jgi:RimJ/RimL family protein N-acetyltransferase
MAITYIRQANNEDLNAINELITSGKKILAAENIPQWQGNYPDLSILQRDIDKGFTYVLIFDEQIVGTATLFQEVDPNYAIIYDGAWLPSNNHYATIHRITVNPAFKGHHLGDMFFSNLISTAYNLGFHEMRIDTHAKNKRMQHLALKSGFVYSGIVYMNQDSTDKRNVYQLFLH